MEATLDARDEGVADVVLLPPPLTLSSALFYFRVSDWPMVADKY